MSNSQAAVRDQEQRQDSPAVCDSQPQLDIRSRGRTHILCVTVSPSERSGAEVELTSCVQQSAPVRDHEQRDNPLSVCISLSQFEMRNRYCTYLLCDRGTRYT
jgi:hypothetical protein